jgi:hypothetical protein
MPRLVHREIIIRRLSALAKVTFTLNYLSGRRGPWYFVILMRHHLHSILPFLHAIANDQQFQYRNQHQEQHEQQLVLHQIEGNQWTQRSAPPETALAGPKYALPVSRMLLGLSHEEAEGSLCLLAREECCRL